MKLALYRLQQEEIKCAMDGNTEYRRTSWRSNLIQCDGTCKAVESDGGALLAIQPYIRLL